MPSLMHDTVSVIVPIYNVEKYLDQALSSLEAQTYPNLEIIAINDGSTDSSLDIIRAHAAKDSRITVADRTNHGYGSGCNYGMDMASGEWIAILEPDDWVKPAMYEDMLQFGSGFDGVPDIIKTPYVRVIYPDTPEERHLQCSYKGRITPNAQPFTLADAPRLSRSHPSIWSALYRKEFLVRNAIRFHEIPGAGWADNPFLMDTLLRAERIVYLDEPYYCYREDTPEKEASFFKRNPSLPFDRWHDMQDILEKLHVRDAGILRMHIEKGFMYRDSVVENNSPDDPAIVELEKRMFDRMDPEIVFSDATISPHKREIFAAARGISCPPSNAGAYYRAMFAEVRYNLKNNGLAYTSTLAGKVFKRRNK